MRYKIPLIALLALIGAASAFACSSSDENGPSSTPYAVFSDNTLTVTRTGHGISGAFLVTGPFDVGVVGDNVNSDNSRILVYEITEEGGGFRTKRVAGSGPKAVAAGTTQRPGPILDLTFDLGPGEFYVSVNTDEGNEWTMTVTGVDSVR